MKLHQILIFAVFIGAFVALLTGFISSGAAEYSQNSSEFTELSEDFNKIYEIQENVDDYEEDASVSTEDSDYDVFGSLFSKTFQALKTVKTSINVFGNMSSTAVEEVGGKAETGSEILKSAVAAIIVIAVSIGIFLHFVTKSERT